MAGSGYFRTTYAGDMKVVTTRFRLFWLIVLGALLLLFPFVCSSYWVHLMNLALINCLVALGLNVLTGRAGVISLGHGGIFAAGAYIVGILDVQFHVPFLLVLPATMAAGVILGLVMGLPSLRLRALYIIVGTMAMHFILVYIGKAYQQSIPAFAWGITVPEPSLGPLVLNTSFKWYPVLIGIVLIVTVFTVNLLNRSRVGRAWTATGDRDFVAFALGIHIGYYKLLAFMFSSALVALGGGLSAYYQSFVTAESYTLWLGVTFVAMVLIGGLGSITGSFFGALFVTLLPYTLAQLLTALPLSSFLGARKAALEIIFFGLLIVLFLILEPTGLAGIWKRISHYFSLWPFRYRRSMITTR